MNFKTISIVKFPTERTWNAMLHHMPDIARGVEALKSITEKDRKTDAAGNVKVVNEWNAKPKLPSIIAKYVKPDMLIWTDTALWNKKEKKVSWNILSHYFRKDMHCEGYTIFEPAMGGKGCRLTFGGNLQWKGNITSLGFGVLDSAVSKTIEAVLSQLIPSNFRKITEALSDYIFRQTEDSRL
jgi:hypothetical protein